MDEITIYARYALCSNTECRKTHESISKEGLVTPAFCTVCKYPLMTACISCGYPFVYRPVNYCGMCSASIFEDDSSVNYIRQSAVLLRCHEMWTEDARSMLRRLAVCLPFLQDYESLDVETAFRKRGLDTLLEPPPETPKSPFLKLV